MTVEQHHYTGQRAVLTLRQGLAAGVVAAACMALVASLGSALAGDGLWTPLNAVGSFFRPAAPIPAGFAGSLTWLGAAVSLLMGGLLGALYASAQERIDTPSLLVVAIYFGLVTWIVATFAILSWAKPPVHEVMRTWPVLLGNLVYGLVLGLFAASRNRLAPAAEPSP